MTAKTRKTLEKIRSRDGRAAAERAEKNLRQAAKVGIFKRVLKKLK